MQVKLPDQESVYRTSGPLVLEFIIPEVVFIVLQYEMLHEKTNVSHMRKQRRKSVSQYTKVGIHFGHVRMYAMPYPISLIIFILDLGPSYTDKLLEFRWVQIAHLS